MPRLKLLDTNQASAYLAENHSIKRTPGTLAIYRVRGGGPKYRTLGRQVRYRPEELDEYARALISGPTTSTSQGAT